MKQLRLYPPLLDGVLVHCRVCQYPFTHVGGNRLFVKYPAQEHNTMFPARASPRLLCALTMRPLCLHFAKLRSLQIVGNQVTNTENVKRMESKGLLLYPGHWMNGGLRKCGPIPRESTVLFIIWGSVLEWPLAPWPSCLEKEIQFNKGVTKITFDVISVLQEYRPVFRLQ